MKNFILTVLFLFVNLEICGLEEDKLSAISKAISFSGARSDAKLVGEYIKGKNDFKMPSLIKTLLGVRNLSSFICCLSPVDLEEIEVSFEGTSSDRIKKLFTLLSNGESLFSVKDVERVDWREMDQYDRAWGKLLINKKNFCKLSCEFDAKREDGVWVISRLMIPFKEGKKGFVVVYDEKTTLSLKDALLASRALIDLNKTDIAEHVLLQILGEEKNNMDVLLLLAGIYQKTNEAKSKELYRKALELCSKRIEEQEFDIKNMMVIKYNIYKSLNLRDEAREYKSDMLLKYPEFEPLVETIDLQFEKIK